MSKTAWRSNLNDKQDSNEKDENDKMMNDASWREDGQCISIKKK